MGRFTSAMVGVVCSMRHGSRLNGMLFVSAVDGSKNFPYLASQISLLFSQLEALPLTISDLLRAFLRYVTALFVAADMSMWLGPGLRFLQHTWRSCSATEQNLMDASLLQIGVDGSLSPPTSPLSICFKIGRGHSRPLLHSRASLPQ